jgi:hypothetical protein
MPLGAVTLASSALEMMPKLENVKSKSLLSIGAAVCFLASLLESEHLQLQSWLVPFASIGALAVASRVRDPLRVILIIGTTVLYAVYFRLLDFSPYNPGWWRFNGVLLFNVSVAASKSPELESDGQDFHEPQA